MYACPSSASGDRTTKAQLSRCGGGVSCSPKSHPFVPAYIGNRQPPAPGPKLQHAPAPPNPRTRKAFLPQAVPAVSCVPPPHPDPVLSDPEPRMTIYNGTTSDDIFNTTV